MNRLSYEMQRQEISPEQLAEKIRKQGLSVHTETVRNWKRGDTNISHEYLPLVAKILGITIEALLAPFEIITK